MDRSPSADMRSDLRDPASAYVFGFMQADGHHSAGQGRKGSISIEIMAQDVDMLRAMQSVIPWRTSIHLRTRSTNFSRGAASSAVPTLCALEGRMRLLDLGLRASQRQILLGGSIRMPDRVVPEA